MDLNLFITKIAEGIACLLGFGAIVFVEWIAWALIKGGSNHD